MRPYTLTSKEQRKLKKLKDLLKEMNSRLDSKSFEIELDQSVRFEKVKRQHLIYAIDFLKNGNGSQFDIALERLESMDVRLSFLNF